VTTGEEVKKCSLSSLFHDLFRVGTYREDDATSRAIIIIRTSTKVDRFASEPGCEREREVKEESFSWK